MDEENSTEITIRDNLYLLPLTDEDSMVRNVYDLIIETLCNS